MQTPSLFVATCPWLFVSLYRPHVLIRTFHLSSPVSFEFIIAKQFKLLGLPTFFTRLVEHPRIMDCLLLDLPQPTTSPGRTRRSKSHRSHFGHDFPGSGM